MTATPLRGISKIHRPPRSVDKFPVGSAGPPRTGSLLCHAGSHRQSQGCLSGVPHNLERGRPRYSYLQSRQSGVREVAIIICPFDPQSSSRPRRYLVAKSICAGPAFGVKRAGAIVPGFLLLGSGLEIPERTREWRGGATPQFKPIVVDIRPFRNLTEPDITLRAAFCAKRKRPPI